MIYDIAAVPWEYIAISLGFDCSVNQSTATTIHQAPQHKYAALGYREAWLRISSTITVVAAVSPTNEMLTGVSVCVKLWKLDSLCLSG